MLKAQGLFKKALAVYNEQGLAGWIRAVRLRVARVRERASLCLDMWADNHRRRPMSLRRARRLRDSDGRLRLHIGCGAKRLPGYVNIDGYPTSGADVVAWAHELRLPDSSVDEIYTSHMIEHLPPGELELALHEWHRVLKPDGKLRIRCPNFELYVREWLEGDYAWRWGWGIVNIFGHDNRGEGLLTRNGFTRKRLNRLLCANGFMTVRCEVMVTRPEYDGTVEYRPHGDLCYEGVKVASPRVLYVDALSEPEAQTNIHGMRRAYRKAAILETFDYRALARKYGRFLMNRLLVQACVRFQPDLVHLGKSEVINGATVRQIKEKTSACVIHFYGDFRWEPQPWVVDIGRYADWTLLYHKDKHIIQEHYDKGVQRIGFWWVGTDPDVFCPRRVPKEYDVVFMANNTSDYGETTGQGYVHRRDLIEAIAARRIDLHLFGKGWESLSGKSNVHCHAFVNDNEFAIACSAAKITVGLNTNKVYFYTSWRRPLNSMACGAFHLTRYFPGLEEVFENGKHLVWFDSIPEAVELIEYYLVHDEERERIAEAGRQEVLAHHTWDHRIAQMFEYMKVVQGGQSQFSIEFRLMAGTRGKNG